MENILSKEGGIAYVWGSGKDGRCGNGSEESEKTPTGIIEQNEHYSSICCGYHHTAGLSVTGKVYTWGRGVFGQLGHG